MLKASSASMISPNPDVTGFILAWLLPCICQLGDMEQLKEGKQKELSPNCRDNKKLASYLLFTQCNNRIGAVTPLFVKYTSLM